MASLESAESLSLCFFSSASRNRTDSLFGSLRQRGSCLAYWVCRGFFFQTTCGSCLVTTVIFGADAAMAALTMSSASASAIAFCWRSSCSWLCYSAMYRFFSSNSCYFYILSSWIWTPALPAMQAPVLTTEIPVNLNSTPSDIFSLLKIILTLYLI